jgi:hypothetical protein
LRRRGGDADAFAALLDRAAGYETRATSSSRAGHRRLFEGFAGAKRRSATRAEATVFAAGLIAP